MRIDKNIKLGGVPIIQVRDMLIYLRKRHVRTINLNEHVCLSQKFSFELNNLFEELYRRGMIDKLEEETYRFNIKTNALANAKCIKPISKDKANEKLKGLVHRIHELNNNDEYLFKANRLFVFGSLINDEMNDCADIDVIIELSKRFEDSEFERKRKLVIKKASADGKIFHNFLDELEYPEDRVSVFLKNRCRYLSFHRMDELDNLNTKILELDLKQDFSELRFMSIT